MILYKSLDIFKVINRKVNFTIDIHL